MNSPHHDTPRGPGAPGPRLRKAVRVAGVLLLLSTPLIAPLAPARAEERALAGGEIKELLSGNSAVYDDGAKQVFYEHGATVYQASGKRAENGTWRVVDDEYCSTWGVGGLSCYRVEYNEYNERTTWNGEYPARIVDGDVFKR